MKHLVIGGAGFLGSTIVNDLHQQAEDVIVYDNFTYSNRSVIPPYIKIIEDDIINVGKYKDVLKEVDYIYYLAQPRLKDLTDKSQLEKPLKALSNFIKASKDSDAKIVFASSCSVYGSKGGEVDEKSEVEVTSLYSEMKIESEKLILASKNANFKIVRLSTLFGSHFVDRPDLMINDFARQIISEGEIEIFDPLASRPHLWVCDASILVRELLKRKFNSKIVNIGLDEFNFTKIAIAEKIRDRFNPKAVIKINNTLDSRDYKVSFDRLSKILSFNPAPIETALDNASTIVDRITCSLEVFDNLTQFYLPPTASPTWYVEEEGAFGLPKTWGHWNIVDENYNLFDKYVTRSLIVPTNFNPSDITYKTIEQTRGEKHLYVVHVFNGDYFRINEKIGLRCMSDEYVQDLMEDRAKLVFICTLEGYSGSKGNRDLEIIESWIQERGIPGRNVYYITGNLIARRIGRVKEVSYNLVPLCMFDSWMPLHELDLDRKLEFKPDKDRYLYLSYARQPRKQRIALCANLLEKDLLRYGKVSLGAHQYHTEHETLASPGVVKELSRIAPLEINTTLKYNLATNITWEDYETTFISIINETLTDQGTLFLSEKIFKPIILGHPFIVLGSQNTLKYLRKLGFKTFDRWFDESYDEDRNFLNRVKGVVNVVESLKDIPLEELQRMRLEMEPILEHNKQHFLKLIDTKYGISEDRSYLEDSYRPIKKALLNIWKTL